MNKSDFTLFLKAVEPAIADYSKYGLDHTHQVQEIFCFGYYFINLTNRQVSKLYDVAAKYLPVEMINERRGIRIPNFILWEVPPCER